MKNMSLLVLLAVMAISLTFTGCGGGTANQAAPPSSSDFTARISVDRWDGNAWLPVADNANVYESDELSFDVVLLTTMATKGGFDTAWYVIKDGVVIDGPVLRTRKLPAGTYTIKAVLATAGSPSVTRQLVVSAGNRPALKLETVQTPDPDLMFTVTTTITNNTDQAMPWVVLKSQQNGQRLTFTTDGATPTTFDIPAGWEIRPGSTWTMTSSPSSMNWVWTTNLQTVNMGNVPAKGWAKLKFKLSPVTVATVSVYSVNQDGSLGAEIPSSVTGYRYLVDGQKYRVVPHLPGRADGELLCSTGNLYNSDYPVRTLAHLSGNTFWCVGPGCNEIAIVIYDKATMAELARCWFPVMVPTPDPGPGLGFTRKK